MQDIALPVRLGPTTLTARIGAGGMGVVYYGLLGPTPVAVKVMRAELADSAEFRARFRREIELMRRVRGVCTARVYAADPDWYPPYLATEFLAGPTLADWILRNGPIVGSSLRTLALGLAEALLAVHSAGVVHRDLKPGNVLLTQGGPKVVDFGIADATDVTVLTRVGTPVGTPGYMSPEQLNGIDVVGPPADVFAWGCTVAYAATGRTPFGSGPTDAVLFRVRHDPPNLVGIPDDLAGLVGETLRKDAAARPDAAELARRLLALLLGPDWAASADDPTARALPSAAEGGSGTADGVAAVASGGSRRPWEPGLTAADLGRGVTVALDQFWPIRAYLPPPPTPVSTALAAGAPSAGPPGMVAPPGQPASPVASALPRMPAGPPPVGRAVPAPWPARQWAPPAGQPVGAAPLWGRPAAPLPPGARVPSVASMPPGALAAPSGPAVPPASRAAMPSPGVPQPALPPRVPVSPVQPGSPTGPHALAPPSVAAPWRARHGAVAVAVVVLGILLVVAIVVASSLLIFHVRPGGRGTPRSVPTSAGVPVPAGARATVPSASAGTPKGGDPVATTVAGGCRYEATTAATASRLPTAASAVPTQPAKMIIVTNLGTLSVELDAAAAPCAVYAVRQLAADRYYDGSFCPRETAGPAALVSILQCGDPTGTGDGSPGFTYAAERTGTTDFGPGVVAMANTSRPNVNGGQFVLSYADPTPTGLATIAAHYTVIGRITDGLDVLDRLAGNGVEDGGSEGRPASGARIESVSISQ